MSISHVADTESVVCLYHIVDDTESVVCLYHT